MRHGSLARPPRLSKGFTLVEVLITVTVLGIGLLGLARLQLLSLRENNQAFLHSQATLLAYDAIERIRTNVHSNVDATDPDSVLTVAALYNADAPETPPNCHTGACTSVQLVSYDLAQWFDKVTESPKQGGLGQGGVGDINCAGSPVVCTITLSWYSHENRVQTSTLNDGGSSDPATEQVVFVLNL